MTLFACRNLTLIHFSLSIFLDSLLFHLIGPTPGLAFFSRCHASGGAIIFVREGLSFCELFTSSFSFLDPYSDYVVVNISLNHSSSLSFLNAYTSRFAFLRRTAEPTLFLPPIFSPPEMSSFWGTSIAITPSETQKVLPTPMRRKYSIRISPLISSLSMTLTHLLFSIAPHLTHPLLPPLLLYLGPGRCFRSWVLITY